MPLYEYRCETCGDSTNIFSKMDDKRPETIECEHCGKTANRFFSTGAVRVKKRFVDPEDKGNKEQIRERQGERIKKMRERAQAKINVDRNK